MKRWQSLLDRLPAAVVGLVLAAGTTTSEGIASAQAPVPSRRDCTTEANQKAAKNAFADGIKAFERKQWLRAERYLLAALEFSCSEPLGVIVPYGRWSYRYAPEIYLGLSLERLGVCLARGGTRCSEWTAEMISDRQAPCGKATGCLTSAGAPASVDGACAAGRCTTVWDASGVYCPTIDWWIKLEDQGVDAAGVVTSADKCQGTTTPVEWFWNALSLGNHSESAAARVCQGMVDQLAIVVESCRAR